MNVNGNEDEIEIMEVEVEKTIAFTLDDSGVSDVGDCAETEFL